MCVFGSRYWVSLLLAVVLVSLPACASSNGSSSSENDDLGNDNGSEHENDEYPLECDKGYTSCDGRCIDTSRSMAHCGGCGVTCFSGQECIEGECAGVGVLSADELHDALQSKTFMLINVRVPPVGIIPGTDGSHCNEDPEGLVEAVGPDPNERVVLYCRTTPRALDAVQQLRARGYTSVSYLDGGVIAWSEAGYDLE